MPDRIAALPISPSGFPTPWFVTWFRDGKSCADGEGVPDFRVIGSGKIVEAAKHNRCWICGGPLGVYKAFVIGPMCAINRVISEPPSHRDCAIYSAKACPFLSRPNMVRNERGLFENGKLRDGFEAPAGMGLMRNPGAVCVWVTKEFRPFRPHAGNDGILFSLGLPVETLWFAEGRRAKRSEVLDSIDSGYPELEELAELQGPTAVAVLTTQRRAVMAWVPA
jgi:hypothetical protein